MSRSYCHKHKISSDDGKWSAAFEELVAGEDEHIEPFEKNICPLCYISLREKYRKSRRQLRGESRQAIKLRSEVDRYKRIVDAVCDTIKDLTGNDPRDLEGKLFEKNTSKGIPAHVALPDGTVGEKMAYPDEIGSLERILPNIIVEMANKKKNSLVGRKSGQVTVLTWVYNEKDIMPFFLRHYGFADRIIVFDNQSDDGTRDIVSRHPNAEIIDWDTGGVFNEVEHTKLKSMAYRDTGPGWKIVVDADEFLWSGMGLKKYIEVLDLEGATVSRSKGYTMVAEDFSKDDGKTSITELSKEGVRSIIFDKVCLFRRCVDVHYDLGCHKARVFGNVKLSNRNLKLLHYRFLGPASIAKRNQMERDRFSKPQMKKGLGSHLKWSVDKINKEWFRAWNRRKEVI